MFSLWQKLPIRPSVRSGITNISSGPIPKVFAPISGIRTERYKLIHYVMEPQEFELYDLASDPGETQNLYGRPQYQTHATGFVESPAETAVNNFRKKSIARRHKSERRKIE